MTAALLDGPASLLPGMSAEVQVPLGQAEGDARFLSSLTTIAPADDTAGGEVSAGGRMVILANIADHKINRIDELLPWNCQAN